MPVKGIKRVKSAIRLKLEGAAVGKTDAAIYAVLSQGAAVAATMTPVDTSTLINSQYAPQIERSAHGTTGTVGYTASYAAAVHEASGRLKGQDRANGNGQYWDPSGEPGFLDKGFEAIKSSVPAILKAAYDVD